MTKAFKILFWALSAVALWAVFTGHEHHIITFLISAVMATILGADGQEEADKAEER